MESIQYSSGYKYQMRRDYPYKLPSPFGPFCARVHVPEPLNPFFLVLPSTALYIFRGYAWDGASGPTIDTKSSMRGSLLHDVIYQAIRLEILPADCRLLADLLLYRVLIEDKMWPLRAQTWFLMVREFAASSIEPTAERPILVAP